MAKMKHYKTYSLEWSRKRYLEEAIQGYFNTDASLDDIIEDIVDTLQMNVDYHTDRAQKFKDVLDGLKSLPYQ